MYIIIYYIIHIYNNNRLAIIHFKIFNLLSSPAVTFTILTYCVMKNDTFDKLLLLSQQSLSVRNYLFQ